MEIPASAQRVLPSDLLHNYPIVSLLSANIITIVLAIIGNWDLATVMFIYWAQSIIIGLFTVVALLSADTFAIRDGLQKPIDELHGTDKVTPGFAGGYKVLIAGFFALHYGLFHWGYYAFIVESGIFGAVNFSDPGIWLSCGLFFANHLYSFFTYRNSGPKGVYYFNELFFTPYQRIIPMHLTIIFGGIATLILQFIGITSTLPVLVLFLLLKTYSDIRAHLLKHYRKKHPDAPVQYL